MMEEKASNRLDAEGISSLVHVPATVSPILKPIGQVIKEKIREMGRLMEESMLKSLSIPLEESDYAEDPQYKCEADKPEGTRDVEKFLNEQQNKLWRGN